MFKEPKFAIISEAKHPIILNAFMDTRFRWYSLNSTVDRVEKMEGGLLLVDNLPEIVYKNAKMLSSLTFHWITLEPKYTPTRLTEIAQKAGVILHFFQYPFQTKSWSIEFLNECVRAFEIQNS